MLKRIKYISNFAKELSKSDIDFLIEQADRNNSELGVTGIIIATGRLFFQIIEGPANSIDEIFTRIKADQRHKNVLVLNSEWGVKDRIFPNWSMKKIDLSSESHSKLAPLREILETIIESRIRIEKLTTTLERAIWEELSQNPG